MPERAIDGDDFAARTREGQVAIGPGVRRWRQRRQPQRRACRGYAFDKTTTADKSLFCHVGMVLD